MPIADLDQFTWSEFLELSASDEAQVAPSFPAFLVQTSLEDLLAARQSTSSSSSSTSSAAPLSAASTSSSSSAYAAAANGDAADAASLQKRKRNGGGRTREEVRRHITPAVISTQTKMVMLSDDIDVDALFWQLPVVRYEDARPGILKKQIQIKSTSPEQVEAYLAKRATVRDFFTELVVDCATNTNVNDRKSVEFLDKRIPFVGVTAKDLICAKSSVKKTFIHCTTLNVRAWNAGQERWNEIHIKIFNTGKFVFPGVVVVSVDMFLHVLSMVLALVNDARRALDPHCAPLHIRHDLTASTGNHFTDPYKLLPPKSTILADNAQLAAEYAAARRTGGTSTSTTRKKRRCGGGGASVKEEDGDGDGEEEGADNNNSKPPDASQCPQGCPGMLFVSENGMPVCGQCGTIVPFAVDHGLEWKGGGGGGGGNGGSDGRGGGGNNDGAQRSGNTVNPTMVESSFAFRLSSGMGGGSAAMRNVAKWMSWFGGSQSEKSYADEVQLLRRVGSVGNLPRAVMNTAEQLLFRLRRHPASRGLTKPMRRVRNIWLACQAHGCPRTVPEMATLFRIDPRVAVRSCSLNFEDVADTLERDPLSNHRNLYFGPMLPGHFVHRFGNRLGLSGKPVQIALFVATVVARFDVTPGNRPHAVAAAALYYVSLCCGVAQTKKNTWLLLDREISEVGIQRCLTKLCFYRLFPLELREEFPLATVVEDKCLVAQHLWSPHPGSSSNDVDVQATTTTVSISSEGLLVSNA